MQILPFMSVFQIHIQILIFVLEILREIQCTIGNKLYLRQFKLHLINISSSKVLFLRRHLSSQKTLPVMLKILSTVAVAVSDYSN